MLKKLRLYVEFWREALKGWRIVYKVCHVERSTERREGVMSSAIVMNIGGISKVNYRISKISVPPFDIPNSKLFCFSTLKAALEFKKSVWDSVVLLSLAKIDHSASFFMAHHNSNTKTFARFWAEGYPKGYAGVKWKPPYDTVFCDEVLPIRVVK